MIPAANDRVYALTVHSSVDTLPPRSWWMAGRAVITTRASSATMKKAAEVSTSAQPREGSGRESCRAWRRPAGQVSPMSVLRGRAAAPVVPGDRPAHLTYGGTGPDSTATPDFLWRVLP